MTLMPEAKGAERRRVKRQTDLPGSVSLVGDGPCKSHGAHGIENLSDEGICLQWRDGSHTPRIGEALSGSVRIHGPVAMGFRFEARVAWVQAAAPPMPAMIGLQFTSVQFST